MDALDTFDAAVGELILRQGMKASDLHKRIRDITNAASKDLPPSKVLYCGSYGEYGYSDEYWTFMAEQTQEQTMPADSLATRCALQPVLGSGDEYRIRDVQSITQFGQHIMDRWPGIAKLVKAYVRNDLGQRMKHVRNLERNRRRLLKIKRRRNSIASKTGRRDGNIEWSKNGVMESFCLYGDLPDLSTYAPSALEGMCTALDAERNKLTRSIQEEHDALLKYMTEAQYEDMLQSLWTKFPEEVKVAKALDVRSPEDSWPTSNRSYFVDAITKYGEYHYAVWKCESQSHFVAEAMRFLLLHPEHTDRLVSEGHNEDCALRLGLCAASKRFCHLRIAEVPWLTEWTVNEYDGQESIDLL